MALSRWFGVVDGGKIGRVVKDAKGRVVVLWWVCFPLRRPLVVRISGGKLHGGSLDECDAWLLR